MSVRSPRIVIVAFAGSDNLGDRCILAVEVDAIRRRYPDAWIAATTVDPSRVAGLVDQPIRQTDLWRLRREIRSADVVILGGGGIVQDDTSILNLLYFLMPIRYAIAAHVPAVSYGLGVGPIHRQWLRRWTGRVMSGMSRICVRDAHSEKLLHSIGVSSSKIRVTADPAITFTGRATDARIPVGAGPRVAVALRSYRERAGGFIPKSWADNLGLSARASHDALAMKLVPVLRWLADDLEAEFAFVPFQEARDERVHVAVAEAASLGERAANVPWPVSLAKARDILAESDLVLGMRLHACILAAAGGTPFAALSYSPKVRAFAESVGVGEAAIDVGRVSRNDLLGAVRRIWDGRLTLAAALGPATRRLAEAETGNIETVARALGR